MVLDIHNGILLVGGGGHCRSLADVLEMCGLPIAGVVHGPHCDFMPVLEYAPLGRDADLPELRRCFSRALVAAGQIKSPALRQQLFGMLDLLGFELPTVVSPLAHVSRHAKLGRGTVVMHNALVNAGADVAENCIINTRVLVEHDCIIESHCHIAVGTVLCGGVKVERGSFIGAGTVVKQGVRICAGSVVSMGSVVHNNISLPLLK